MYGRRLMIKYQDLSDPRPCEVVGRAHHRGLGHEGTMPSSGDRLRCKRDHGTNTLTILYNETPGRCGSALYRPISRRPSPFPVVHSQRTIQSIGPDTA